jgi:hypothetical protein
MIVFTYLLQYLIILYLIVINTLFLVIAVGCFTFFFTGDIPTAIFLPSYLPWMSEGPQWFFLGLGKENYTTDV